MQKLFTNNAGYELVHKEAAPKEMPYGMRDAVDALIAEEMEQMEKKDYLAPLSESAVTLAVESKDGDGLDLERIQAPPPKESTLQGWISAIDNVKAQIEHNNGRLANLNLATKHAKPAWTQHITDLTHHSEAVKRRHDDSVISYAKYLRR